MKTYHAFYSACSAKLFGTIIYERQNGSLVEVTAVCDSREQGEQTYMWPDKRYVGEVIRFVKRYDSFYEQN